MSLPYDGGAPAHGQERAAMLWFEAHAKPRWVSWVVPPDLPRRFWVGASPIRVIDRVMAPVFGLTVTKP